MDVLNLVEKDYDEFTAEELNLASSVLFAYHQKCEDYGVEEEFKELLAGLPGIAQQMSNDSDAIIMEGGTPQSTSKDIWPNCP